MTHGSLTRDIPRLEPDDEFVDRLAQLAAASKPTRGGIVMPVAFQGPAARSLATAAAVAAIAAGATVAATQLGHPHDDAPAPPTSSVGPSGADDDRDSLRTRPAQGTDASQNTDAGSQPQTQGSTGPGPSSSTQAGVATHDHHGSPGSDDSPGDHGSGGPGDSPSGHDGGGRHDGSGGPGSSGGSDGSDGSQDGGGSQDGSGGKDSGGGGSTDSELDGSGD